MDHDLGDRRVRVAAIIQVRMSSSRLPGKALATLGKQTALELLVRRLKLAAEVDEIAIATSTDPSDDPIEREAQRLAIPAFRGALDDVLDRYVQVCDELRPDAVVRITGDCPLTDAELVDQVIRQWRRTGAEYVSNTREPRSFPDGLDVEVIAADALRRAANEAHRLEDREHVTSYIRRNPGLFSAAELRLNPSFGSVRITLDTPTDLRFLRNLVSAVGPDASMTQVLVRLGFDSSVSIRRVP